jgi:hypothetical protein
MSGRTAEFLSRLFAVLVLAGLLLTPLVVALLSNVTWTGLYEESLGFRYFYSLRRVLGETVPFLPQAQLQDAFCYVLQLFPSQLGDAGSQSAMDRFAAIYVGSAHVLAITLFSLWPRTRHLMFMPAAAVILGGVYLSHTGAYAAALQPDYFVFILPIGILTVGLFISLNGRPAAAWQDAAPLALLLGVSLATKATLAGFFGMLAAIYIAQHQSLKAAGVLATAAVAGGALWLVAIAAVNYGDVVGYFTDLKAFVETGGNVAINYTPFFRWWLLKLIQPHPIYQALAALPVVGFLAAVLLLDTRPGPAPAFGIFAGASFFCWVLYRREYPATDTEIAVFEAMAFTIVIYELLTFVRPGRAQQIAVVLSVVLVSGLGWRDVDFMLRSTIPLVKNLAENKSLQAKAHEAIAALPAPQLWLIPYNSFRPLMYESGVRKGVGSNTATLMKTLLPETDVLLDARHFEPEEFRWPEEAYRTVLFATTPDASERTTIRGATDVSFDFESCRRIASLRLQYLYACQR